MPHTTYGEPVKIDDHTTIIPVSRQGLRGGQTPLGVFTISDGVSTWTPVVDDGRVALLAILTGLIAATIGTMAVFKQPPWPKVVINK